MINGSMQGIGRQTALLGALLAAGVSGEAASGGGAASHGPAGGHRLPAMTAQSFRQKLESLKGRIVVLNLWATWCQPCVREFPELVRFERAYRPRGVVVIGLSMDDPQRAQKLVPPFVAEQRAGFPVLVMKTADDTAKVVAVVDPNWEGSIPMTYVLDRSGHLRTRLRGAHTLDAFEMAVDPLLAKG